MDIGSILNVWLGSEYASEIMFDLNVWFLSSHLKYTKTSLQKTLFNLKLKVQILKEGKHEKIQEVFPVC